MRARPAITIQVWWLTSLQYPLALKTGWLLGGGCRLIMRLYGSNDDAWYNRAWDRFSKSKLARYLTIVLMGWGFIHVFNEHYYAQQKAELKTMEQKIEAELPPVQRHRSPWSDYQDRLAKEGRFTDGEFDLHDWINSFEYRQLRRNWLESPESPDRQIQSKDEYYLEFAMLFPSSREDEGKICLLDSAWWVKQHPYKTWRNSDATRVFLTLSCVARWEKVALKEGFPWADPVRADAAEKKAREIGEFAHPSSGVASTSE
jgi:hypothetical protein